MFSKVAQFAKNYYSTFNKIVEPKGKSYSEYWDLCKKNYQSAPLGYKTCNELILVGGTSLLVYKYQDFKALTYALPSVLLYPFAPIIMPLTLLSTHLHPLKYYEEWRKPNPAKMREIAIKNFKKNIHKKIKREAKCGSREITVYRTDRYGFTSNEVIDILNEDLLEGYDIKIDIGGSITIKW